MGIARYTVDFRDIREPAIGCSPTVANLGQPGPYVAWLIVTLWGYT
ncbi:MAG: hypothetical protein AVDCRST_MAG88-1351 [uncultured Thermomicrobiales bacterium]|uniref:Uncharacterized protein n=1 Tax=uncultured Thermomicrobiales bacterium TaxID=1645740 RepID=A0A6J4UT63_9BACT|nr:MAG: hypothetical protein AVDCRST_MAG88-1351 [uncultured Thermomicrobiales bacterium]